MAASPDGVPLISCKVRKVTYAECKGIECQLQEQMVTKGYGIPEGGAWEKRRPAASKSMARRKVLETRAREEGIGIWGRAE